MDNNNFIITTKDCNGVLIPSGEEIQLKKGTQVKITQSLGGYFTLYVNGNLVKIDGKDADVIGEKIIEEIDSSNDVINFSEKEIWDRLKTCYDPEIPVNIVDLGLIYDLQTEKNNNKYYIKEKMTLTAPGCGMGPAIAQDVESKIKSLPFVSDVLVELVWDPQWNQDMMTEEAKLQLGMI